MKAQIQTLLDQIIGIISQWDGVDTVTLMQHERDPYDPYFFLSFDVYTTAPIPNNTERSTAFSFTGAFETSTYKDRFLHDDLPVRLEYKEIQRFDNIINAALKDAVSMRDSGTYAFYRIMKAETIHSTSDWLETARTRLSSLSGNFWDNFRWGRQAHMEHFLTDLSAAAAMGDELFFLMSASGFISAACGTLFAINHEFEPPPRQFYNRTLALKRKPDTFQGLLESFIRHQDTSFERKREIAELLARRIVQL